MVEPGLQGRAGGVVGIQKAGPHNIPQPLLRQSHQTRQQISCIAAEPLQCSMLQRIVGQG